MEDKNIVELIRARDERGIGEAQKKYGKYCLAIAERALGNKEDAEETVSDALLAAWEQIPPAQPGCLRVFLGRIARNLAITRYRRQSAEKRGGGMTEEVLEELSETLRSTEEPEREVMEAELTEAVRRFVRQLPEKEGNAFLLRYFYLLSPAQIAEKTGQKENYVRTLLSRAREKLRTMLQKEELI